ncbi:helix-turn-helix transcriptional regulator [Cupriavidus consociatus]|uniref:helix-turn-helix transcriptional regulator n=1 Tax=Cupriavidus consociatus TaxID=2821357 RepID=UPI001AE52120|nr:MULTISPECIES: LuxR C-terminal-related transcriptional regulator [unclassified Cupriavidus]MBP0622443.1 response regulator transcription factor [Cupriavidus sp. LEh25]MDK2659129.1 LuxR C-terminal-related transcriptional regulator [Cupriavidus sp. LEh21]
MDFVVLVASSESSRQSDTPQAGSAQADGVRAAPAAHADPRESSACDAAQRSPELDDKSAHRLAGTPSLTPRERDIALRIAFGRTSKQIAREFGLSDLTVRKHRENLYRKLGVGNAAGVAIYCLRHGLLSPPDTN